MKTLIVAYFILFVNVFVEPTKVDNKLLKCLVCRSTITEFERELAKIDPSIEIEVGNYRLDAEGNAIHKKIPLAESEVHMSDMLDNICNKMSDYVKATYKSNGQLTILNLMTPAGTMNPEMGKVDIIQDGDFNKSLKYYCEGVVEEFEDSIISLFTHKENNIKRQLCTNIAKLCNPTDFSHEDDENIEQNDMDEDRDEL
ncbi:protein seele isoform X1 [Osmia bicornis bicornis]|uniref:protein seele isoform X1 n=1 Tax=Osmia bicornis bicornis TaxID=1437191 RepID=UPI0010F54488|nr:protein seele isoform X1 [Osmia bicornis bicornis]